MGDHEEPVEEENINRTSADTTNNKSVQTDIKINDITKLKLYVHNVTKQLHNIIKSG